MSKKKAAESVFAVGQRLVRELKENPEIEAFCLFIGGGVVSPKTAKEAEGPATFPSFLFVDGRAPLLNVLLNKGRDMFVKRLIGAMDKIAGPPSGK